ncbi:hypothetical protein [Massilia sp. S19_KUP03_FR1]|uniref:hypothetical protein n=1 Tax=Massilia sp. S19_KUP03_FR1 TaxID=3025503 RepID=UPI002FCDAD72
MNQRAQQFLDTYAAGRIIDGGWLYPLQLAQTRLDQTDDGLDRLDILLDAITEHAHPTAQDIQQTPQGRNFCALIAYHLIDVVRRRTGAMFEWYDRAAALRILPQGTQIPDAPYTQMVAYARNHGAVLLPLDWIEERLLGSGNKLRARHHVANLIETIERNGPAVWWTGMDAVGRIAAWQMMIAANGGPVTPLRLSANAPTSWLGSAADDVADTLAHGARLLEQNPEGAMWQVFAYDGLVDLQEGRQDAIMVVLHTYGHAPLRVKIAFSYRPAKVFRKFAILPPLVREMNMAQEKIGMLNGAMKRGIDSIRWPSGLTWDELSAP